MKLLRVLVLMHPDLIPPPQATQKLADSDQVLWGTEFDVLKGLRKLGHQAIPVGVYDDIRVIQEAIDHYKPHVVFNLLEEFNSEQTMEHNIVSYLELIGIPYTGCSPQGLMVSRNKILSKEILLYHSITTPAFEVYPYRKTSSSQVDTQLFFPLIAKFVDEDGSVSITYSSVIHTQQQLEKRISYMHAKYKVDVLIEEYIPGRELYVGIHGNSRVSALPIWELFFSANEDANKRVYTRRIKNDQKYKKSRGIRTGVAKLDPELQENITKQALQIGRLLSLDGYARIDFRLRDDGTLYFLESNPNPDIARKDEFALAAAKDGIDYLNLLNRILSIALNKDRSLLKRAG